jgi:beta-aspartyl-peptidase (threonine type)
MGRILYTKSGSIRHFWTNGISEKSLKEATKDVIQNKLTKLGGTGAVVALDKNGNMSFEFNTAGMYRASMNDTRELVLKIYKEEET